MESIKHIIQTGSIDVEKKNIVSNIEAHPIGVEYDYENEVEEHSDGSNDE